MFQISRNNIPFYQFTILNNNTDIEHFTSTREGGVSIDEYSTYNLSYATKDKEENIDINRKLLASAMNISQENLIFPAQTHEDNILIIDQSFLLQKKEDQKPQLTGVDALLTKVKNICICILTADCVPLLIYDPVKAVIGAVHAGWRGTVKCIAAKTIYKMQQEFLCNPSDLLVGIGPSIGPESYEVGIEVAREFEKVFGNNPDILKNNEDKYLLNLWEANLCQLLDCGVKKENIEVSGICTYKNDSIFYSSRKNKGVTGRFASGIMLH